MKLKEIKNQLGTNTSSKKLKKIINSIVPGDIKRKMKGKKNGENIILQIIRSKLN